MGWDRRLQLALGALLIALAVWLALDPPSSVEDQPNVSLHGNPCDSTIVQAFGGRSEDMLDATEGRVCTTPARKQLAVAAGLFVIGIGVVVVAARNGGDLQRGGESAISGPSTREKPS